MTTDLNDMIWEVMAAFEKGAAANSRMKFELTCEYSNRPASSIILWTARIEDGLRVEWFQALDAKEAVNGLLGMIDQKSMSV